MSLAINPVKILIRILRSQSRFPSVRSISSFGRWRSETVRIMELPKPRKGKGKQKKLEAKTPKDASLFLLVKLKIHWWIGGLLFTGLLSWVVMPVLIHWDSSAIENFSIGEKSLHNVISPGSTNYNDVDATQREKERVKLNVPLVFDLKKEERLQDAKDLFSGIRSIRAEAISAEDKIAKMASNLIVDFLSKETRIKLATITHEEINEIEKNTIDILDKVLSNGVVRGGGAGIFAEEISPKMPRGDNWQGIYARLQQAKGRPPTDAEVVTEMEIELLPSRQKVKTKDLYSWLDAKNLAAREAKLLANSEVVSEICHALIRPNVFYNEEVTNRRRQEVAVLITATNVIKKGEKIISQGEEITQTHLEKLKAIKPLQKAAFIRIAIGTVSMVAFLLSLLLLYLRKYEPQIFSEYRKIVALAITILLSVIAEKLLIIYFIHGLALPYPILLIPAVITSAMVAILISPQLAILVTIIICVFIGVMSGINIEDIFERLTLVFCVGMVAIFSLSPNVRRRRDMMVSGLYVCLTSPIIVVGASLSQNVSPETLITNSIYGIASGVIVVILVPGLLPVFEYLMKTTTDIQLLEFSDLNHPLLRELEGKTPGTYHHSMNVSSLSEAAAGDIKANALLARVGSYYHDIGKMKRPEYFSENQKNGKNMHNTLGPSLSADLIKAHVEHGIEMARKHRLPKVIEDMIPQHHGTTLVSYFYSKAQETEKHGAVEEDDYRYGGPKPQTKEAAIMMLADSVEAAARSMMSSNKENPTYKDLRELVQKIVNMKISDDFQLDESNLTLSDLSIIVDSFSRVLEGMYHSRVVYPSDDKKELNGASIEIKAVSAGRN